MRAHHMRAHHMHAHHMCRAGAGGVWRVACIITCATAATWRVSRYAITTTASQVGKGGGDVRSVRFPRVAKQTHVDYHQSMLLRSMKMQPHLHGPQYRSVTRTMAHDKVGDSNHASERVRCGAVQHYHKCYSHTVVLQA